MSSDTDDRIDSVESFAAAIESVLEEAHRSNIDVEGGWLVETADDVPDWDVEIWSVESPMSND